MKLFVANSTRSRFILNVRVPEINQAIRLDIASGCQRSFPLDLSESQWKDVSEQLARFGARKRSDVHGKLDKFTGLVYSLDKPISEDEIVAAFEDQIDSAQTRSVTQATRSALSADLAWRDKNNPKGKRKASSVKVEVLKKTDGRKRDEPLFDLEISEQGSRSANLPV